MRKSLRPLVSLALFAVILSLAGTSTIPSSTAAPPETAPPTAKPALPANRPVGDRTTSDAQLASWLIVDNETEIALSKMAAERSRNPGVQKFAELMVEEHQQMLDKLQKYAGTEYARRARPGRGAADRDPPPRKDRDPTDRPLRDRIRDRDDREPARTTERVRVDEGGVTIDEKGAGVRVDERGVRVDVNPRIDNRGQLDFVRIKQELGEACLQTARHEFELKTGEEFDRCYIGFQVAVHMQAIDTMKVFQRHASNDLDDVLANSIKTVETHLEQAKKLAKELEGKTASTAARTSAKNE